MIEKFEMKRVGMFFVMGVMVLNVINAQDDMESFRQKVQGEFQGFARKAEKDYEDFRRRVNMEYAELMEKSWKGMSGLNPKPVPKENPVPPVIRPKDDKDAVIKDKPVPYKDVIPVPAPKPQPRPVSPVIEEPQPVIKTIKFGFFGSELSVRSDFDTGINLRELTPENISEQWKKISERDCGNTISDCISIRKRLRLSDWAYFLMLDSLSARICSGVNDATLLHAYLYAQTGYMMRLGICESKLYVLYASEHEIYKKSYYKINGTNFYPYSKSNIMKMTLCDANFPGEEPMSLLIKQQPELSIHPSKERRIASQKYQNLSVKTYINLNLIDFYNTYPTSMLNGDFCTRWAMYANVPKSSVAQSVMYPQLMESLMGLSEYEAVSRLLDFVQTGFVYEYDDKVWGEDRAFFPDETIFYPYCDCEDRSILFSRLVRDLLGLKVVLVYYPGHLASAVAFNESVKGDYLQFDGKKYTICDPTYIGAPVGATMPGMNNMEAKLIQTE